MIIKLIIFVCLAYLAYRLLIGPPLLSESKRPDLIDQEPEKEGFTDYEEID